MPRQVTTPREPSRRTLGSMLRGVSVVPGARVNMRYARWPWACCCVVAAASVMLAAQPPQSQRQTPNTRADWPCGARIDPSYFHLAEATGGHLFLLAPFEIGDSAPLMLAVDRHPQTIFRLAGSIAPGVHEFDVPIDSSIESVLFSISVQCLQNAEVLRPSGVPVAGEGVSDYSNFRAERMVVVNHPEPGMWKVRAGGSGIAAVMVQARADVALAAVEFAAAESGSYRRTPLAAVENAVRLRIRGDVRDVQAIIVNGAFKTLARLPLTASDEAGTFMGRFSPGADPFRVAVAGTDPQGVPFQRVDASLFTAR